MTKLLICEDSRLLADALGELLSRRPNFEVTDICETGELAVRSIKKSMPDLVLMDLFLPDITGIELTRSLLQEFPDLQILGFSSYKDPQLIKEFLVAGAIGFISKNASTDELLRALDSAIAGEKVLPLELSEQLSNKSGQPNMLSPRELAVLQLIGGGLSTVEVAERLKISPKTVETHRLKIMAKMGTNSIADLTKIAVKLGLTSL